MEKNSSIILASKSPRRRKLLQQIGLPFSVEASMVEEYIDPAKPPEHIVQSLALQKAEKVASSQTNSLIIGADTIVVYKGGILEKPASEAEAVKMLTRLSGQTHQVYTGVALVKTRDAGIVSSTSFAERTEVSFGELQAEDIQRYAASGSPMDKAGAYGIQDDMGALFVKAIKGDYYTVVGFPLYAFYQKMKTFAPEYLQTLKEVLG